MMPHRARVLIGVLIGVLMAGLSVDAVIAQNVRSPEVHDDRSVTFRLNAREAQKVVANVSGQTVELARGDGGVWEGRSAPLSAGIHDYSFSVDGTMMIDPSNRAVKKWLTLGSMVEIPGDPPLLTELQNVPHGVVHRMMYHSQATGTSRPVMVYTPPDYEPGEEIRYPLILLLHGFGDDETAWTEVGRAHFIADNLIAAGELLPCIIAMPYGHPVPVPYGQRPDDYFRSNNQLYERDLMQDLLPFLESKFPVRQDAAGRSIAGLSMGGGHALDTGLRNVSHFSCIGAFSAATPQLSDEDLTASYQSLKGPNPAANALKHLWIPIGETDFLLDRNEKFVAQLQAAGVRHEYTKTPGGHEWKVWREYLPRFLKMAAGMSSE